MTRKKSYWLVKTEPSTYSIEDLERDGETEWDGVRNYAARNYMRDEMAPGDEVLVYHSSTRVLGVYGRAEVARAPHPDSTQFDEESDYHDPDSSPDDPTWWCVDLRHLETFDEPVTREAMKERPGLEDMKLLQRGMRLSVMPVAAEEYRIVLEMAESRRQ